MNGFAADAIMWAVAEGLITGDGGKLNPQGTANRAVTAAIMNRFASAYEQFLFESMLHRYGFSSGAGAWGTYFYLEKDGTFTGRFHDSEMGETGDGYPNGTVYISEFSGKFSAPQ